MANTNVEKAVKETAPVRQRVTRETRVPLSGARDILTVKGKDPNYVYRWVVDSPGRIERLQLAGYEVDTAAHEVGQMTVDRESKIGSATTKASGDGRTLVLMRIPKEWFDMDQAAKQEQLDAHEATMRQEAKEGHYGILEVARRKK